MWDPAKFNGGEAAASRKYERTNPSRYAPKASRASAPPKRYTMTDRPPTWRRRRKNSTRRVTAGWSTTSRSAQRPNRLRAAR
jgi:hypothetical protein